MDEFALSTVANDSLSSPIDASDRDREVHYRKFLAWRFSTNRAFLMRMRRLAQYEAPFPSYEYHFPLNSRGMMQDPSDNHTFFDMNPSTSRIGIQSASQDVSSSFLQPRFGSQEFLYSQEAHASLLGCSSSGHGSVDLGNLSRKQYPGCRFHNPAPRQDFNKKRKCQESEEGFIELPSSPPRCPQEALQDCTGKHLSTMLPQLNLPSLSPCPGDRVVMIQPVPRSPSSTDSSTSIGDELDVATALCDMSRKVKSRRK